MPQSSAPTAQVETPVAGARTAPTATEMYEAARLARSELRSQQGNLQGERRRVREQLTTATNPADIKGLEGRLAVIDERIADVEKQLAAADAQVAARAAIPGVIVEPPRSGPDPEAIVGMGMGASLLLLLPLSIGYARRLWKRAAAPALSSEVSDRMANLERGIEAIAIEVERMGEGQRFVTQLLTESDRRRQIAAQPAELRPGQEL
ncbi:MAG TPA: hypothetical protein VGJ96_02980 [Gemmatimonadaceae bacterium]|jgi:hypothetical protein